MKSFDYRVSVIIPVYNAEEYLRDCLDSLLNQTINNEEMEVLMINDGSQDNSLEICKEYSEIYPNFKVFSKENEGLPKTRNFALQRAQGKYITYLDSDDKYSPETLKNLCDFFDKHYDEIDEVTYPIVRYKGGKTLPLHYRYKYLKETRVYDLNELPFISQSNINICVKNMFENNILFDTTPNFRHEDQAYNSQMLSRKMKIGFVKEAEYQYNRDNDTSIIASYMYSYYIFETTTRYFEKLFEQYEVVPQYYQAQFFNDLVWKFAEDRLWPFHYSSEDFATAKKRIERLLDQVDVDVIMSYPSADNYQKLYWLRQKKNISMFPYLEIMFENNELAWEISDYLELEEDEIKRFRKRKIPKKVITKMEKLKNERREAEKEKRNEELKKQMLEAIPEVEEIAEEEPVVEEEIIPEIEETPEPIEEEKGEPVKEEVGETKKEEPKKSKDKQVSLFDF